jgi:nicotinate-nucleotide pyrophosphorylase (carboxylating)
MGKDFAEVVWDAAARQALGALVELAIREDLDRWYDWTTVALVPEGSQGRARVVARAAGVAAGLAGLGDIWAQYSRELVWQAAARDGEAISPGQVLGVVSGPARSLLSAERVVLNFLGHLSGVATLTRSFVEAVAGTRARIYDTRKTLPGYRLLEKYAVRCGGGRNHRQGLYASVLIKDNHLAFGHDGQKNQGFSPAQAVERARQFVQRLLPPEQQEHFLIEVEVDRLEQLAEVLPAGPEIVLVDNLGPGGLAQAVALRDRLAAAVELEASGGVRLETVAALAATGVDRISVGALTHSAQWLDVGLDWD